MTYISIVACDTEQVADNTDQVCNHEVNMCATKQLVDNTNCGYWVCNKTCAAEQAVKRIGRFGALFFLEIDEIHVYLFHHFVHCFQIRNHSV